MWPLKYKHLPISTRCELMCHGCQACGVEEKALDLPDILQKAAGCGIVNICGGDPLIQETLPKLVQELKLRKKIIYLTTNGLQIDKLSKELLFLIDLPIIYLPGTTKETYLEQTGFDYFSRARSALEYLDESNKKFVINFPVRAEEIGEVPLMYDLLGKFKNAHLILTFHSSLENKFNSETKKYFNYYLSRKKITGFQTSLPETNCLGCLRALETPTPDAMLYAISAFTKGLI